MEPIFRSDSRRSRDGGGGVCRSSALGILDGLLGCLPGSPLLGLLLFLFLVDGGLGLDPGIVLDDLQDVVLFQEALLVTLGLEGLDGLVLHEELHDQHPLLFLRHGLVVGLFDGTLHGPPHLPDDRLDPLLKTRGQVDVHLAPEVVDAFGADLHDDVGLQVLDLVGVETGFVTAEFAFEIGKDELDSHEGELIVGVPADVGQADFDSVLEGLGDVVTRFGFAHWIPPGTYILPYRRNFSST